MAQVQLGQFVVRKVAGTETGSPQIFQHGGHLVAVLDVDAHQHMGVDRVGEAGTQLGDVAAADGLHQLAEAARLLGDGHAQQGFAVGTEARTLGHMAQAVEIHVGAADHGHQGGVAQVARAGIGTQTGQGQRTGRFGHHAGIFKDILDGAADGVRVHGDDVVQQVAAKGEGLLAHQLHGHAVGEQAHVLELHTMPGHDGTAHGVGVHGFHADDADLGPQVLHIGGHAGGKSAPADGHENGVNGVGMLTQDLHADGALSGNDIGIVKRRDEHVAGLLDEIQRMPPGIAERLTEQHHLSAQTAHGIHLDGGRGHGHDDDGFASQTAGGQGHPLGMVAGRGGDDAAAQLFGRKTGHLVVGAAQLEGKHRLQVVPLEQHAVAQAAGKAHGLIQRGLDGHVVDPAQQHLVQVLAMIRHGKHPL